MLLGFIARCSEALLHRIAVLVTAKPLSKYIGQCALLGLASELFSKGAVALLLGYFCFVADFLGSN
jgi:hypothetical protein